jgi:hypothetical protein
VGGSAGISIRINVRIHDGDKIIILEFYLLLMCKLFISFAVMFDHGHAMCVIIIYPVYSNTGYKLTAT